MKKLSEDKKAEIILREKAGETQQSLAKAFDCAQSTINRVLNQARKAKSDKVVYPNPASSTDLLQKRYWSKYKRLVSIVEKREAFLSKVPNQLEEQITTWDNRAKYAPTQSLAKSYQHRADSYRLELASLDDLSEFNNEMLELLTELQSIAEVLVKVRKAGLGKEKID